MIIGKKDDGKELGLNLDRLIETRLLLQANSGGGKSWALRRILEQTHGKVQQIVIDVEDEFATLREHFDYVLAGGAGADCPADTRSAALLARRLLELNTSAIIGIYELKAHDRVRFVRLFLDSLVNAPRELWHPVLVVVDEAHIFCPQHGEAESASAVIDLMTRGRKRGFCGILATQRISKLHKDAAAEANNKLIGRSALDVDMKRAGDELGFTGREDLAQLRVLKPGEFFAFGPAISDTITKLRVGEIRTTHPRAGQHAAPPPPPRDKVKAVLAQLADLPKQAETEARTVADLQNKVRELEQQIRRLAKGLADDESLLAARMLGFQEAKAQFEKEGRKSFEFLEIAVLDSRKKLDKIRAIVGAADATKPDLTQLVKSLSSAPKPFYGKSPLESADSAAQFATSVAAKFDKRNLPTNGGLSAVPSKAQALILTALSQYPQGRSKVQVALLTGYAHNGGSFSNAIGALRTGRAIEGGNELLKITQAGADLIGPVEPLPRGVDLLRMWQRQVSKAEREILDALFEAYPRPLTKSDIAAATSSKYQAEGGSFNNALGRLRTLELIKGRREMILSEQLV